MKMLSHALLYASALFTVLFAHAQSTIPHRCGFDQLIEWRIENEHGFEEHYRQLHEEIEQFQQTAARSTFGGIFYIPVVFHVITDSSNLSTSLPPEYEIYSQYHDITNGTWDRIDAQLERLNTEFANSDIRFCLAQNAPPSYEGVAGVPGSWQQLSDGVNPPFESVGVTYHASTSLSTYDVTNTTQVAAMDALLPFNVTGENKTLDIYIVDGVLDPLGNPIEGISTLGSGFPFDDVVIAASTAGDVSNAGNTTPAGFLASGAEQGKVLVHEVGHWLSLLHTFADDEACLSTYQSLQGDYISDTPPQASAGSCFSPPALSCNGVDIIYFNNHMDYSCDAHKITVSGVDPFTPEQIIRLNTSIQQLRSEWYSELNRIKTGIQQSGCIPNNPPLFTAEFEINTFQICLGGAVELAGMTTSLLPANASIVSWEFTITEINNQIVPQIISHNGNTDISTTITAGTNYVPGMYSVALEATYLDGSSLHTFSWTHPTHLVIEDCSASPFKFIKAFDFESMGLSDLSIVPVDQNDGFYIISGTNHISTVEKEIVIFKVDALGEIIWQHIYQNTDGEMVRSCDIIQNDNIRDHYLITGYYQTRTGELEVLLLEIQDMGNYCSLGSSPNNPIRIPVKTTDLNGRDLVNAIGTEIINTSDGGFAIAGAVSEGGFSPTESTKLVLIKLRRDYGVEWIEEVDYSQSGDISDHDFGNSVVEITAYDTPGNPSSFRAAYFLGGSRSKRSFLMHQGIASVIIEDNGSQRDIVPFTHNTWRTQHHSREISTDVIYDAQENLIYQLAFTWLTHGQVIVKIDPATGSITSFQESNLLSSSIGNLLGHNMIHSNGYADIIVTGLAFRDTVPTAQKMSKANWPILVDPLSNQLDIKMRLYPITPLLLPATGPNFPLFSLSRSYYFPKSICTSPNGGYMQVMATEPSDPNNRSALHLLKLDEDLKTGCVILDNTTIDRSFRPGAASIHNEGRNITHPEEQIVLNEATLHIVPCSDFCLGNFIIEACDDDNDGKADFNLEASLSNILGSGYQFQWYQDPHLTRPVNNPFAHSDADGGMVYVYIRTPDNCFGQAEVTLNTIAPPVVNNITLAISGGVYNLANAQVMVASPGHTINWFEDAALTIPISNITSYPGNAASVVYAQVISPEGCTAIAMVTLTCPPSGDWPKQSIGNDEEYVADIVTDMNGNYFVTGYYLGTLEFLGYTSSAATLTPSFFVAKFTDCGLEWVTTDQAANPLTPGSQGTGIDIDNQGNVYVSGTFSASITLGTITQMVPGLYTSFAARFSPAGVCEWITPYGANNIYPCEGLDIAVDASSGWVYTTGYSTTLTGLVGSSTSYFVRQHALTNGVAQWTVSDPGSFSSRATCIDIDGNGNILIAAWAGSGNGTLNLGGLSTFINQGHRGFVGQLNASGIGTWVSSKTVIPGGISVDANDDVIVTGRFSQPFTFSGTTYPNLQGNYSNISLMKYSNTGTELWAKTAGATTVNSGANSGWNVTTDQLNNIYLAGSFNEEAFFGGIGPLVSAGGTQALDYFVAKYSALGAEQWVEHTFSGFYSYDQATHPPAVSITSDHNGFTYLAGGFYDQIIFGSDVLNSNPSNQDFFIARLEDLGTSANFQKEEVVLNDETRATSILVYPNPSRDIFTVEFDPEMIGSSPVIITNTVGRVVQQLQPEGAGDGRFQVNLSAQPNGIYFLKMPTPAGHQVVKLMVQH